MIDPFMSLLFIVGGLCLLMVVYKARVNMTVSRVFHNGSYQLGMVMGTVILMLGFGIISFALWLLI